MQSGNQHQSWRPAFSVRTLLLMAVGLPVFVGVAEAIDTLTVDFFGFNWIRFVIDVKWSLNFYPPIVVAYSMEQIPAWLCLGCIGFTPGLVRSRVAHGAAWLLAAAVPIAFMLSSMIVPEMLAFLTPWVMPLGGSLLCLAGWTIGWRIRGRFAPHPAKAAPRWVRVSVLSLLCAATLFVSAYGWYVLRFLLELE